MAASWVCSESYSCEYTLESKKYRRIAFKNVERLAGIDRERSSLLERRKAAAAAEARHHPRDSRLSHARRTHPTCHCWSFSYLFIHTYLSIWPFTLTGKIIPLFLNPYNYELYTNSQVYASQYCSRSK